MTKQYSRKGLLYAIPIAAAALAGCKHADVLYVDVNGKEMAPPANRTATAVAAATPTPVTYEGARAYLLENLRVNPTPVSTAVYGSVNRSGEPMPDDKKNSSLTLDDKLVVLTTRENPSQLSGRVMPIFGEKYFDIEGIKFREITFNNYDPTKESFGYMRFTIVDPHTGKEIRSEHKPVDLTAIAEEDKLLANTIGRYILQSAARAMPGSARAAAPTPAPRARRRP